MPPARRPAQDLIITPRTVRCPPPGTVGVLSLYEFVAIDIETSGTSHHRSRIIEVGAVKMNHRGEVLDRYGSLANPGRDVPLNPAAQKIHNITPHMVWSAPPTAQVLEELREFIGNCGVVAHNLGFENRFLTAEYQQSHLPAPAWQGVCTLAASRKHVVADSHKLGDLLIQLEIDAINDHRAVTDAEACGQLLATLIDRRGVSDLEPLAVATPAAGSTGAHVAQPVDSRPADPTTSTQPREAVTVIPASKSRDAVRRAMGGFDATEEQSAVIDAFQTGEALAIRALAGTGKTSTLLGISRLEAARDPRRRGLYIAFNKSVAKAAEASFPSQVQASTAHALARRHLQSTAYGPLLAKLEGGRAKFREIADAIGSTKVVFSDRNGPSLLAQYPVTRLALATVEKYCTTMDTAIGPQHVPDQKGIDRHSSSRAELVDHILPIARRAWRAILDPHNWTLSFTHSHYLKLWADMHPRVGAPGGYILFDEAQDANPLLRSIVADQDHLQRIYVGDENQAIYSFTGAINAMADIEGARYLSLTQSWRFGPAIADAANVYLGILGSKLRVRGNPGIDARIVDAAAPVDAVLCRTNGAALVELMEAQKAGKRAALIGDTETAVRFCESATALKAGIAPRDSDLAAFGSWAELQEYVEHSPGVGDLKTLVELVDSHGVDAVRAAMESTVPPNRADLISATCHKVKGLEFQRVRINHQWEIEDGPTADPKARREEQMLAYVGLTRAKDQLDPGQLLTPAQASKINERYGHHLTPATMPPRMAGQLV